MTSRIKYRLVGAGIVAALAMASTAAAEARSCDPIVKGALLLGLGTNALFGWWWADPVTALVITAVAVNEGREALCGESCCVASGQVGSGCC